MNQVQITYVKVPEELLALTCGLISANPSPVVPVGQILEVLAKLQQCETITEVGLPVPTPESSGAGGDPSATGDKKEG